MEHNRDVCESQVIMLYPKRFIAKLTNLYRRLIMSERNEREPKLNEEQPRPEITVLLAEGDEERELGAGADAAMQGSNVSVIIVETDGGEQPQSESPDTATLTIQSHDDEGPILDTGISRRAFCIQLDSLLQRNLGITADTVSSMTNSKGGQASRKR